MKRNWSSLPERMMKAKIMNDSIKVIATKKTCKLSDKELLKRKFRKFLYDNDVLETFASNKKNYPIKYSNITTINKKDAINWIASAFLWNSSTEGYDYWQDLSHKWIDMCI